MKIDENLITMQAAEARTSRDGWCPAVNGEQATGCNTIMRIFVCAHTAGLTNGLINSAVCIVSMCADIVLVACNKMTKNQAFLSLSSGSERSVRTTQREPERPDKPEPIRSSRYRPLHYQTDADCCCGWRSSQNSSWKSRKAKS